MHTNTPNQLCKYLQCCASEKILHTLLNYYFLNLAVRKSRYSKII